MQQRHISVDIIGGVSGFKTSTEHPPPHKIVRRICEIRLLLFIQKEKGEEQKKWKELEQKKECKKKELRKTLVQMKEQRFKFLLS